MIARLAVAIGYSESESESHSCLVDAGSLPHRWQRVAGAGGKAGERLRSGIKRRCALGMFLWAGSVVGSRAMTIRGNKYLVPVADFHNHLPHPEQRDGSNGERFLAFHSLHQDRFVVKADRPAIAGEQAFEDYGDSDPIMFFVHHGFVAPVGGTGDCARLQLPRIDQVTIDGPGGKGSDQDVSRKRALLGKLRMHPGMYREGSPGPGHICVPPAGEPLQWVWTYLRVHAMHLEDGGEHYEACKYIIRSEQGAAVSGEAWDGCLGGSPRGSGT